MLLACNPITVNDNYLINCVTYVYFPSLLMKEEHTQIYRGAVKGFGQTPSNSTSWIKLYLFVVVVVGFWVLKKNVGFFLSSKCTHQNNQYQIIVYLLIDVCSISQYNCAIYSLLNKITLPHRVFPHIL